MNNESDLWNCESYLDNGSEATTINGYDFPAAGNPGWTSNNTDTVYPLFGPYAGTSSTAQSTQGNDYSDYLSNPNLLCPAAVSGNSLNNNTMIGKSNVSHDLTATQGVPAMAAADFYQNNRGSSAVAGFTSAGSGDATGWVAGDKYLHSNGSTSAGAYAMNVNDIVNKARRANTNVYNSNWETQGYKFYTGTAFNGYTEGPGYWGKTFAIWPPDPSPASLDGANAVKMETISAIRRQVPSGTGTRRQRLAAEFLLQRDRLRAAHRQHQVVPGRQRQQQQQRHRLQRPAGNYVINYKAILYWIQNVGPNPFPSQRAPAT